MSYLGNARTLLLFGTNVKDDIVPDNILSTFNLSQEVPGGYEGNVLVVRRRYILDELVSNTFTLTIDGTLETITTNDAFLASVFSTVLPEIVNVFEGDNIILSGCSNPANNGTFPVTAVSYNGTSCTITVNGNLATESGGTITVTRGYVTSWEVLEPEIDYVIGGIGPNYNKQITFTKIPQIDDALYVVHRGDATYNFVPTGNSVGPEQLQQNLRNFVCDRYTGDGSTTVFALDANNPAVSSKALLVSLDGVVVDGDDDVFSGGVWVLNLAGTQITFDVAPANGVKIRVLHLGFSTVSRRAALSPGQVGALAPNSITSTQLGPLSVTTSKIDNLAVTTGKIANDAVDGTKILLNNNEALRSKKADTTPTGIIKLNAADQTKICSPGDIVLERNSVDDIVSDSTSFRPNLTGGKNLGTSLIKWGNAHFSGDVNAVTGNVNAVNAVLTGNVTVAGTVDGVDVSALAALVAANAVPAGTIVATARATAPSNYLLCDGSVVSQTTYASLFSAIATAYNTGGEGVGNFRLPDLRGRFPLGKAVSGIGSTLGATGGNLQHTHTITSHDHTFSHTHGIPAHYHPHDPGVGSTLAITGISGDHPTSLGHTHLDGITPLNQGTHVHTVASNSGLNAEVGGIHSHLTGSLSTSSNTINIAAQSFGSTQHDHTHTHRSWVVGSSPGGTFTLPGNPFNPDFLRVANYISDPGHFHQVDTRDNFGSNGTSRIALANNGGAGPDSIRSTTNVGTNIQSEGGALPWETAPRQIIHDHSTTVGFTGVGGHFHTIVGTLDDHNGHPHFVSGTVPSVSSGHQHTVPGQTLSFGTNSINDGTHTHAANTFSGQIGNANIPANNGNNTLTTSSQSTITTSSNGATTTSLASETAPFCVVNYIIKT